MCGLVQTMKLYIVTGCAVFEPSALKVLRYLRRQDSSRTSDEIARDTGESLRFVTQALAKLARQKVVEKDCGGYRFGREQLAEALHKDLADVCTLVSRGSQMELLVRGLLCAPPQPCFMRLEAVVSILTAEGYSQEKITGFIDDEIKRGYVQKAGLLFFLDRAHSIPTYVPQEYISPLSWVDMEVYHEWDRVGGEAPSAREEFLRGNYSRELASAGREYLDKEKAYIKEKLREEAMRNWFFWWV